MVPEILELLLTSWSTSDGLEKSSNNINFESIISIYAVKVRTASLERWTRPTMAPDPTPAMKVSLRAQTFSETLDFHTSELLLSVCLRAGADRSHSQIRLRGTESSRAVVQEGSVAAPLPPSLRGLVGGAAQRRGRAHPTPVHRGAGHVSRHALIWDL